MLYWYWSSHTWCHFFQKFFPKTVSGLSLHNVSDVPTLLPPPRCTMAQVSTALCTDVPSSPGSLSDHTVNSNPVSFSLQWFPSHLNITSILPLYLILALPASLPAPYIYYVLAEFTVFKTCLETSCFRAFLLVWFYLQICHACLLSSAVAILSHLPFLFCTCMYFSLSWSSPKII